MSVSDVYALDWNIFDEVPVWRPCASCGTPMILGDIAMIVHPEDDPNHPSDLCAVLCESCARHWRFEVTGDAQWLGPNP